MEKPAAVLKGRQLLTEPVANNDIFSYRPLLILTVEIELGLAIWLLSGLFAKAAWLVSLLCFSLFSAVTLYKGIAGYASCGCFGSVHVNPWITLFAIDLPSVVALSFLRPGKIWPLRFWVRLKLRRRPVKALLKQFIMPFPSIPRFAVTACLGLTILSVTTPILAINEPARVTSRYEVLEPENWVGKELPILKHIEIIVPQGMPNGKTLKTCTLGKGTWLVLLSRCTSGL